MSVGRDRSASELEAFLATLPLSTRERAEPLITAQIERAYRLGAQRQREVWQSEREAWKRVLSAWMVPGIMPSVHRVAKSRMRHTMPLLARELDRAERRARR